MVNTGRVDQQGLITIGTVVAIFASAFGVFVAIDQLTWTSRHRRLAEFLAAAIKSEEADSPQRQVLDSLRRDTVARLVGASAVPAWTMAGDAATIGAFAFSTYSLTPLFLERWPPSDPAQWWSIIWPTSLLALTGWIFIRSLVVRIDERRRIADDHLAGNIPLKPRIDFANPLEGKAPWIQVTVLTFSVMVAAAGAAEAAGTPPGAGSSGFTWVWAGIIMGSGGLWGVRQFLARRRGHLWQHPEVCKPADKQSPRQ